MTLDFWQIIFKEEQRAQCYDFAKVHFNETVTDYFENSVIAQLVPTATADLVSVCSWRLKQKRNESSTEGILRKQNGHTVLTEQSIVSTPFDVAVLTPRNKMHQPLAMASNWHGKPWDNAFAVFKRYLRSAQSIKVPDELSNTIYENHFVARRDLYQDYVSGCLIPSIEFMKTDPVFFVDAGYVKRVGAQRAAEYTAVSGRSDFPIAPFVLERLFSIWIEAKGLKVVAL